MVYRGLKFARSIFQFPWEMRLNKVFLYDAYVHFTFNLGKYLLLGAAAMLQWI